MNTIQEGSFLTLHYRLAGPDGADLLSTFGGQPATFSLGAGQLSPAMEQRLLGLTEGARAQFDLAPDEAFGPRNPDLVQRVSRAMLRDLGDADAQYLPGEVVQFPVPKASGKHGGGNHGDGNHGGGNHGGGSYAGVVCESGQAWVMFDCNHPLAGQPVAFEVQVIAVL